MGNFIWFRTDDEGIINIASIYMATLTAAVWIVHGSEASASSSASASCYRRAENVRVLAIVVAELEFRQIERQVLPADVMIRADHATLQDAPERFNVVGVDLAADIFFVHVGDDAVLVAYVPKFPVAARIIGGHQIHLLTHRLADKGVQRAR